VIEVKCRNSRCGGPGMVVLHRFRVSDGAMIKTLRFREPERR